MLTRPAEPPSVAADDTAPFDVPRDTSPTWELELLISGAVLFTLFQLPGAISNGFASIEPLLTRGPRIIALMGYWYGMAAVLTLIVCFVMHLTARAYWVGLVGLHSVFPRGPRWERSKFGPVTRELYRERLPPLPSLIARTDNFCSVIFSFAFLIVMLFAMSVVLVGTVLLLSYGISAMFGGPDFMLVYSVLVTVIFMGPLVLRAIDKQRGATAVPGSPLHRRLRRFALLYYRVQLFPLYGSILTTLFSNVRGRVIYPAFIACLLITLLGAMGATLVRNDLVEYDGFRYFDDDGARAVRGAHYESQWIGGTGLAGVPSIQSDVVAGPYVKLFVPYVAGRHDAAVARECPGAPRIGGGGLRFGNGEPSSAADAAAVLACLARLHAVSLDGRVLADMELQFHTHPRSGAHGMLAYIPADGLSKGRHVVTVRRVRNPRAEPGTPERPPFEIPFWR
jgi:hypothetical protein